MFIIDNVIGEAVSYFFKRVESSKDQHDEAIGMIKVAMRGLSASFGEVIEYYKKSSHRLQRFLAADDMPGFWQYLSQMLDDDRLRGYCNASGVCQELRVAQDKLFALPIAADSKPKRLIADFASQLEAYEMGLVNKVVPDGEAVRAAEELAHRIMQNAPIAVEMAKDALEIGKDLPLEHAVQYSQKNCVTCFSTEDMKEGTAAFLEKRKPQFKGR